MLNVNRIVHEGSMFILGFRQVLLILHLFTHLYWLAVLDFFLAELF